MVGISKEERERRLAAAKQSEGAIDNSLGNASFGNDLGGLNDPEDPMNAFMGDTNSDPQLGQTDATPASSDMAALLEEMRAMREELSRVKAGNAQEGFDYARASWLQNPHGVKVPATPYLREHAAKFKLRPCDPPADYIAKKGG